MEKAIALIGFGSQAKTWALNLRSSGREVRVFLRENSSSQLLVREMGFKVFLLKDIKNHLEEIEFLCLLTPDHTHREIYQEHLALLPYLNIVIAHGWWPWSEKLEKKNLKHSVILLAPKCIASEMRFRYETKAPLGAVYSLELAQESRELEIGVLTLAQQLGLTGVYPASIKDETAADLFSEQVILCSTLPYIAKESYDWLVAKGVPEQLAYLECWFELKLIVDAMIKKGPVGFFNLISPNALYGGEKARELLIDENFKIKMGKLWDDIEQRKIVQEINNTDIEALRKKVIKKWQESSLTKHHNNWENIKE
jgi:ketol-acid reductoisomerase